MNWIALSLLAPAIYTVVNFIDKYIVEHKVKNSWGMPIYGTIVAFIFGSSVWLLAGMPTLNTRNSLLILAAGMISMFAFALYFYALSKSQTSYIIALFQTIPIFVLIISAVVLKERLSAMQLAGFFLVFSAVIGLSIDKVEEKFRVNKAFYFMLSASILLAVAAVLIKYTVDLEGFFPILAYESWGLTIGGLILFTAFPIIRNAFFESFKTVGKPVLGIMFFNESLFVVTKAMTFLAISLGPVALVTVLAGTQVFYGILYGLVLTLLFPKIFSEDTAKKSVLKKITFALILFTGIWLISRASV